MYFSLALVALGKDIYANFPLSGSDANASGVLPRQGIFIFPRKKDMEAVIDSSKENAKPSGNALSAEERSVLARAEIVCQKRLIAMLRAEFHDAVRRIRRARRMLDGE